MRRFNNRPEWNRPDLWPVIADPARSSQRRWLSEAISTLSDNQRRNVLGRLQSDRHFLATYNELAVIALVSDSELMVEYEPRFTCNGRVLTPDVALRRRDGSLIALVEVSTRFRTAEQRSLEIQWKELRTRVSRIPRPVGLLVRDMRPGPARPPDSGQARRIEGALRSWLLRPSTVIGATYEIEGYWFRVAGTLPGLRARIATPTGTGWYNTDMVREPIAIKVSRYASLAGSLDTPLIVILAAEPAMPISLNMLRAVLSGAQAITIAVDPFMIGPATSGPMRLNERDIPAEFDPELSMVGWLDPGVDEPGTLTVFEVLSASRRLTHHLGERVVHETI